MQGQAGPFAGCPPRSRSAAEMDGCSRQNPAYRLATEGPRIAGAFYLSWARRPHGDLVRARRPRPGPRLRRSCESGARCRARRRSSLAGYRSANARANSCHKCSRGCAGSHGASRPVAAYGACDRSTGEGSCRTSDARGAPWTPTAPRVTAPPTRARAAAPRWTAACAGHGTTAWWSCGRRGSNSRVTHRPRRPRALTPPRRRPHPDPGGDRVRRAVSASNGGGPVTGR